MLPGVSLGEVSAAHLPALSPARDALSCDESITLVSADGQAVRTWAPGDTGGEAVSGNRLYLLNDGLVQVFQYGRLNNVLGPCGRLPLCGLLLVRVLFFVRVRVDN